MINPQETTKITKEVYEFFWDIKNSLSDSIKKSFISGELSTFQKQTVIKIIKKKDRDKRLIKNCCGVVVQIIFFLHLFIYLFVHIFILLIIIIIIIIIIINLSKFLITVILLYISLLFLCLLYF